MGFKKVEFCGDSKFIDMCSEQCSENKLQAKKNGNKCKIPKAQKMNSLLPKTFYHNIFKSHFN